MSKLQVDSCIILELSLTHTHTERHIHTHTHSYTHTDGQEYSIVAVLQLINRNYNNSWFGKVLGFDRCMLIAFLDSRT